MELVRTDDGSVTVLSCSGRFNMTAAPQLKAMVDQVVGAGLARVVVDLGEVAFIDSSGLGALVSGLKACRQAGGDLRIARCGEQVRMVLGLTNLDRILRPFDDVEDARRGW